MFYETNHIGTSDYFKKEYGTDFSFPPHMHQCFEFITTLSGSMSVTVDNRTYLLSEGEALLIFPNQIHSLSSTECEHMLCIFSPKLVTAYSSKIAAKKPVNNQFVPDKYLVNRLNALNDHAGSITKKGLLYLLCDEFDCHAVYEQRSIDSKNLLEKIFLFIEQNFNTTCSLNALAKEIGYDYAYLSKYFKRSVGISFNEYVNIYRLNNVCYLLNNTEETILHCALESGYTSLRSFNRNFKNRFGISPSEYINGQK